MVLLYWKQKNVDFKKIFWEEIKFKNIKDIKLSFWKEEKLYDFLYSNDIKNIISLTNDKIKIDNNLIDEFKLFKNIFKEEFTLSSIKKLIKEYSIKKVEYTAIVKAIIDRWDFIDYNDEEYKKAANDLWKIFSL